MSLLLKTTRCEYELSDRSGYRFKILAEQDAEGEPKGGWRATVTLSSEGRFTSADAAVMRMQSAAEHFIRILKESRDGES